MTYIAISLIHEPLRDPAVNTAGKEPTRGLRVHYCYPNALQMAVSIQKIVYFRVYRIAGNFHEVKIFAIFVTHDQNAKIRTMK